MSRILTGIQSTGTPHLGNLLGEENEGIVVCLDDVTYVVHNNSESGQITITEATEFNLGEASEGQMLWVHNDSE